MHSRMAWAAVGAMISCMASAQILFKVASTYSTLYPELQRGWLFNPWLGGAVILMLLGMGFWTLALKRLPLSQAYPWTALIYILTPLASIIFFDDSVSPVYVLGMMFICIGIFLTTRNVEQG